MTYLRSFPPHSVFSGKKHKTVLEGMVKLSASAGEIMKRCDGQTTVMNIIEDLHQSFPDADLDNDVYKFLEVAHANGWIRKKQPV